ncbi:ATP-binding protein [Methylobacterium planeticum]|uniref:ATP-binding protein n=1 Tax=Methylobacterium planeticum TaxID=2615211 RepID=UPI0017851D13|nr:AAA family ATPase [Methylobacterium planeticum]
MGRQGRRTIEPGISLRGERRELTIVFSDLVGFTKLSASLDPEDLNEVIGAFEEQCRQALRRFGGYLEGFHGDCVLAFFGYPAIRGDEAARAVMATLAIHEGFEKLRFPDAGQVRVHSGISTGVTAVFLDAGTPRFVGEPVNLAARLQKMAAPGEILVSEATRSLAGAAIETEHRGERFIRGVSDKRPIWRAVRLKEDHRNPEPTARGRTPLIGREPELRALAECWARSLRGEGQKVVLCGEPGIGKSRLVRHFCESLIPAPRTIHLRCDARHASTAFHPFTEFLRTLARRDGDALPGARERAQALDPSARERAQAHVPSARERAQALVALISGEETAGGHSAPASAAPFRDPASVRRAILERLMAVVTGIAAQGPTLIVLEDEHWIDPSSLQVMNDLGRALADSRALILVTSRTSTPQERGPIRDRVLRLSRLSNAETADMLSVLLGECRTLPSLAREICARASGLPLFIEEVALAVKQEGGARRNGKPRCGDSAQALTRLPRSVQELVLITLDQISSADPIASADAIGSARQASPAKKVAQIASVIGNEFDLETLQRLVAETPGQVRRAILLLRHAGIIKPLLTPERFAFHHALVREGAYDSLLKKDRIELHRRIAAIIQRGEASGGQSGPEIAAYHYAEAGLVDEAVKCRIASAGHALERAANFEVIAHASEALALLERQPARTRDRRLELAAHLLLGTALWSVEGFASTEVETAFKRARILAEQCGDAQQIFVSYRGLFGCYYGRGKLDRASQKANEVKLLAERMRERSAHCIGHMFAGQTALWRGRLIESQTQLELSLLEYDEVDQRRRLLSFQIDPAVNAGLHLSWGLWLQGHSLQAKTCSDAALSSAREFGQPFGLAMALFWKAVLHTWLAEREVARTLRRELRELVAHHTISYLSAPATILEGEDRIDQGDHQHGIHLVLSGLREFQSRRGGLGMPWSMSIVAEGCLRSGQLEQGSRAIATALAAARRNQERYWEAELYRLNAELIFARPVIDHRALSRSLSRGVAVARSQGALALQRRIERSVRQMCARHDDDVRVFRRIRESFQISS